MNKKQDMTTTLYTELSTDLFDALAHIKLLVCDVDGVFSDGRIYLGNDGEELKAFHTRDGYGVKAVFPEGSLDKPSEMFIAIIHRAIFKMNMVARESICGPIVVQEC